MSGMNPRLRRVTNIIIALMVIAVTAYAFLLIQQVLKRPYGGFGVYPHNRVAYIDTDGPAAKAGLREGMRIIKIDGKPVGSVLETVRTIEESSVNTTIRLTVRDPKLSRQREFSVRLVEPPIPAFLLFATLTYLIFISLALFVYYRRPDDPPVVLFTLVTLTGFIAMLTSFAFRQTMTWPGVNLVRIWCTLLTFPLILHFTMRFPVTKAFLGRYSYVQALIYLPAVLFSIYLTVRSVGLFDGSLSPNQVHETLSDMLTVSTKTMFLAVGYLGASLGLMVHTYRNGTPQIRQQVRTLLIGGLISVFPMAVLIHEGINNYARFLLGGLNPPLTIAFSLLLLIPTALALVRYRLTDLNDALMRSFLYVAVFMIIIGIFMTIEAGLTSMFEWLVNERWASISRYLSIIFVAILFKPIHDGLYLVTDRTINPRRQRYREHLQDVSALLTTILDLKLLSVQMVESLSDALETGVVGVFGVHRKNHRRVVTVLAQRGLDGVGNEELSLKIPFLLDELEKGRMLSLRTLEKMVPSRPYLTQIEVLRSVLMIPIMRREILIGFISLGEHAVGTDYSGAARELVQTLARHAAVAIENARSYQKIADLNRELSEQVTKIGAQQQQILVLQEKLLEENVELKQVMGKPFTAMDIIGSSNRLKEVLKVVAKVAGTDSAVLIIGESGTGKELFAHALHANSNRHNKAFIKVNCAALAENLLESELFGHEKGAFTGAVQRRMGRFELADGGTLFLDEIGELSMNLQVKLLRVLQEKEFERVGGSRSIKVDVRIVTATNRNIEQEVQNANFREDLYYRLNVIRLEVPPLRDREQDILELAVHFLNQSNKKTGKSLKHIDHHALDCLMAYPWPGNVRELENLIERAVVLADSDHLTVDDFPPEIQEAGKQRKREREREEEVGSAGRGDAPLPKLLEHMERETLLRALQECDGNKSEAARRLGLARSTFFNKLKKFGLA